MTTTSGKHLEDISHARTVYLLYKLITSVRGTGDLSIEFDQDCRRRQQQLTNNKNMKGKYHVRIMLEDVLRFAEHQRKTTYGLGYKLTLRRIRDDTILDKAPGIDDA